MVDIVDPDLLEQLNNLKKGPAHSLMLRHLERTQEERNKKKRYFEKLTPIECRRELTREVLKNQPLQDTDRYHIHSVLALCGLPYRRPKDDFKPYIKHYGKNSLVVQSGFLKDPTTGDMAQQGVPYGPKARLLMLHICTQAVRQNTHKVEIADNMTAFIRELGFKARGGKRGEIRPFKEQLARLAASHMQIGLWDGNNARTLKTDPIEAFDVWFPDNPKQGILWSSKIYLDPRFFVSLKEHALPVDVRALWTFTQSARQMDIILWLGYRLRSLESSYLIPWSSLQEQFGQPSTHRSHFQRDFKKDLQAIAQVYPKLPVKLTEKGMKLHPQDPENLFVPPKTTTTS